MISMAPLQGFTDYVYRKIYSDNFRGVHSYFIPYISIKNGVCLKKHLREVLPENNLQDNVVPQVLIKNEEELNQLVALLKEYRYGEININLGCPYPMVTKRGKGAGLLPFPEKIESILNTCFDNLDAKISVKLRSGLDNEKDVLRVIKVLNKFPLKEIIYHPRIAKQLYKGKANIELFEEVNALSANPLVYNGDVNTLADYSALQNKFPKIDRWMLGRGLLMDPFLPEKIINKANEITNKTERLWKFHEQIFIAYSAILQDDSQVLMKLTQFWAYFSFSFAPSHKAFKLIKKAKDLRKYNNAVDRIFNEFT